MVPRLQRRITQESFRRPRKNQRSRRVRYRLRPRRPRLAVNLQSPRRFWPLHLSQQPERSNDAGNRAPPHQLGHHSHHRPPRQCAVSPAPPGTFPQTFPSGSDNGSYTALSASIAPSRLPIPTPSTSPSLATWDITAPSRFPMLAASRIACSPRKTGPTHRPRRSQNPHRLLHRRPSSGQLYQSPNAPAPSQVTAAMVGPTASYWTDMTQALKPGGAYSLDPITTGGCPQTITTNPLQINYALFSCYSGNETTAIQRIDQSGFPDPNHRANLQRQLRPTRGKRHTQLLCQLPVRFAHRLALHRRRRLQRPPGQPGKTFLQRVAVRFELHLFQIDGYRIRCRTRQRPGRRFPRSDLQRLATHATPGGIGLRYTPSTEC